MKSSSAMKASGRALAAAALSLGGAWLAAGLIQRMGLPRPAFPPPEIAASPEVVAQGRDYFLQSCSECHGDDAHGEDGPDLYRLPISNAHIAATVESGIKGEMPSFSKKYHREQIGALVVYLRTLR